MPQKNQSKQDAIASIATRVQGMDTTGILTMLLKSLHQANEIPNENQLLRKCLLLQYGLSRNPHIVELLEPPHQLTDMIPRTENGLQTLERLRKPSFYPHSKTLGPLKTGVERYKHNREEVLADYDKFMQEKKQVIINVILRLQEALEKGDADGLENDQVISNQFDHADKTAAELLYKSQKLAKEKTGLQDQLRVLLHLILEDIPVEQRPVSEVRTEPTPQIPTSPRANE